MTHPRPFTMQPTLGSAQQSGAVLAVALILLLALTVLGVAALNGNKLQTRLAYNSSESTKAFQAAETALASGEIWLSQQNDIPTPDCTPTSSTSCSLSASVWDKTNLSGGGVVSIDNLTSSTWWAANGREFGYTYVPGVARPNVPETNQVLPQVAETPRYVVQYLGTSEDGSLDIGTPSASKTYYYEVSARGTGGLAENNTVVQSVYAVRY